MQQRSGRALECACDGGTRKAKAAIDAAAKKEPMKKRWRGQLNERVVARRQQDVVGSRSVSRRPTTGIRPSYGEIGEKSR